VAKPVAVVDDAVRTLVADMAQTMYEAPGIGLAATQVDVHSGSSSSTCRRRATT
jgi:peptide deformylase